MSRKGLLIVANVFFVISIFMSAVLGFVVFKKMIEFTGFMKCLIYLPVVMLVIGIIFFIIGLFSKRE